MTFGMLLKSYKDDLHLASRLMESFHKHNAQGISLYCVVPEEDLDAFGVFASQTVTVLSERHFDEHFTDESVNGIRPGYINQEIVKLAFWEMGLAEDYFCVDSDAVFISDFGEADFIAPDGYPYTVLVEDKDLLTDPEYFHAYWQGREAAIQLIAAEIGWQFPVIRTCHGHQVFNSDVLRSFKADFLEPRGWDYLDALELAPYEFSWYNLWLQSQEVIPIHAREPYVKVFHSARQHIEHILSGTDERDLARAYIAVVVNSNYSREIKTVPLSAGKSKSLAPYLSYTELLKTLGVKVRASLQSIRRSS